MEQGLQFDVELIRRYDKSGPRYTSYPTAPSFTEAFTEADYRQQIELSNNTGGPLSLYFHIPFCDTVCFYCACNKIITKNRQRAETYLKSLFKEIAQQAELFDSSRIVNQLHWGGGTPTFLSIEQMRQLMAVTRQHFNLHRDDSGEYSIEIDPREANAKIIAELRALGFNRISLGVQDFDGAVQKAVNRIQSEEETFAVLDAARSEGFKSVSMDLIYGLPLQTVGSFEKTLDKVLAVEPDRLSIFNYAHMPALFKVQRQINEADLPSAAIKLDILQMTTQRLISAGYVYVGMDHYAKPSDDLVIAQQAGQLYRNFQGYSTHADCDLIGFGVSSIGRVADAYVQNAKDLQSYQKIVEKGSLPIQKGYVLSLDDQIRRVVINELICHFEVDFTLLNKRYEINSQQYFANEIEQLKTMAVDGLLECRQDSVRVKPIGRMLIRNICMVFDAHLAQKNTQYSKVI